MKIIIRCDMGGKNGMGHVQRMLSIAGELYNFGAEDITFLTMTPMLKAFVEPYDTIVAPKSTNESNIFKLLKNFFKQNLVLIIDHKYRLYYDASILRSLRQNGVCIVRVDHMEAEKDTADLVIMPNAHQSEYVIKELIDNFGIDNVLHGWPYVLCSENVLTMKRFSCQERPFNIVFLAGGSDPDNYLALMMDMTGTLLKSIPHVQRIFCIGTARQENYSIRDIDSKTYVTGYSPSHLQSAAITVTMFGVTTYESIYLGTPAIVLAQNNQRASEIKNLDKVSRGSIRHFGKSFLNVQREEFCEKICELWWNESERYAMHAIALDKIDGLASTRIAEKIVEKFNNP